MGVIEIEDMKFFAFHGHYREEQLVGNNFTVNVRLETDCSAASESDNLEDALNYVQVYSLIREEMEIPSKLLEHVAKRILDRLYSEFGEETIECAVIKISKHAPPMGGEIGRVSVSMAR